MAELSIRHADYRREFLQISWTLSSLIILAVSFAVSSAEDSCGGIIEAQNGTITSPSFPGSYPPNQRCIWRIRVQPLHYITLKFNHFHLEIGRDWVDVHSISDNGGTISHGRYSGTNFPPLIVSSTLNHLEVEFFSDSSVQMSGFAAVFSTYSCGGTIEAQNGTITSPSFPEPYPPNHRCVWEILVRPLHRIKLNFTQFDLGDNPGCVKVRIGSIHDDEKFHHSMYCGIQLPPPITYGSSRVQIEYTLGGSIRRSRFDTVFSIEIDDAFKNHSIDLLLTSRDPIFYEYDFDPVHLEQKLINISSSQGLLSDQYRDELKRLTKTVGTSHQIDVSSLRLTKFITSLPDTEEDPDENTLANTITYKRLALMFPEYFRFDLVELDVRNFSPQCQKLNGILPEIMKHPEFAGLIPTSDGALKETERNALIVAYLYWQFCNVAEAERSDEYLEKLGSIAMKRIELSRLPNELRIKVLKAKRIIEDDDRFFGTNLELSKSVPSQVHYVAIDFPNFAKI